MTEDATLEHLFAGAKAAADKRATDLVALDVRGLSSFTDYFLIASGSSDRRVQAIADAVVDAMKERGLRPLGKEGTREGRWVLVDFGDWVVHVFYEDVRGFYDLEGLWFDAKRVELPAEIFEPAQRTSTGTRL
jgi:ribosome-associated protein